MQETSKNDPAGSPNWKQPLVLLIDHDGKRQFERAASMRRCGVSVDCAEDGATAIALWQPEKYRLVLFELSGAKEEVRAFCVKLQELSPQQKIGIYRSTRPFIVHAQNTLLPSSAEPCRPVRDNLQDALAAATQQTNRAPGLAGAAQRIAALRPRRPGYVPAPRVPDRPKPESNASIAARVLGGEK